MLSRCRPDSSPRARSPRRPTSSTSTLRCGRGSALLAFITVLLLSTSCRPPQGPRRLHQGGRDRVARSGSASASRSAVRRRGGTARQAAGEYYAGYLIEKSLSVDNVFVWALIFSYFVVPAAVPAPGAVLGHLRRARAAGDLHLRRRRADRAVLDGCSTSSARSCSSPRVRLIAHEDSEVHPEQNPVLKLVQRVVPSTTEYDGQKLFTRVDGRAPGDAAVRGAGAHRDDRRVFAVDSVPAVLAVSHEQFIVFARTRSRSSGCARSTSCSPACTTGSPTCSRASRSSWRSSASR